MGESKLKHAHKLGLFVHAFTFRNENRYLAHSYLGDPHAEYLKFFRLGWSGRQTNMVEIPCFCDRSEVYVAAGDMCFASGGFLAAA
jgi:hypothetical protein